jgi:PAS domain S-box-containing protein
MTLGTTGRYFGAAGLAIGAELARLGARHVIDLHPLFLFLYLPFIVAAALWLGFGPGLLCTTLCLLALAWYGMPPTDSLVVAEPADLALLLLFGTCAVFTCFFVDFSRRNRSRTARDENRFQAEVKLREAASAVAKDRGARLEAILNTAAEAIFTIDDRGIIGSTNIAAERLFGYSAAEMIGGNVSLLMPAPYQGEHDDYLATYLRTGAKKVIGVGREVEGRRKDGTMFPLHIAVSEVQLDGRRHFTGFIRDLSEEKRLEREFLQAQKMEAIGSLAGGIAHDFNNLLMGILACSRMSVETLDEDTEAREMFHEIGNAAQRGIALTRRLLAFSRRQPVPLHPTSINAVIRENEAMLRQLLGEDVELCVELAPSGANVIADESLIDQVLINLLVNARDAMPAGGRITVRTSDGAGDERELVVADDGCGMSADVRARIFEPFFSTKGPEKGTGLGLATVKRIVDQLSGRIEIESEVGRGTRFVLSFPAAPAPAASPRETSILTVMRPIGKRVLVVEDDRLVRASLQRFLSGKGYDVLAASDASEAIELSANGIDVLVTDMVLPGASGHELAREIRGRAARTQAIFISAHPADLLHQEGKLEPGAHYLQKPFALEELDALIARVLGDESLARCG